MKTNVNTHIVCQQQTNHPEIGVRDLELDCLPPRFATYVKELVTRYSVPASAIVPACLATAGAAVGPHARIRTGLGTAEMPTSLFAVISVWPETRVFQRGPRKGLVLLGAGVSDFPAFDCHSPNIR